MFLRSLLPFILTIAFSPFADARLDTIAGSRVSIAMAQSILAAPPLPGLESKDSGLAVQGTHMTAHMSGYDAYSTLHYNADFTGGAIGVGYTSKMNGNWNLFAIGQFNQSSGEGNSSLNNPIGVHKMKQDGYVGFLGAGYRLLGKDDGKFGLGVFAGGGAMQVSSHLTLGGGNFYSDAFIWGPVVGAQMRVRLGKLSVRPYAILFYESSDHCKRTTSDQGTVSNGMPCRPDAFDQVNIPATFSATGLYLGWGHLALNVYSQLKNDEAMSDLVMFNYSFGWTF